MISAALIVLSVIAVIDWRYRRIPNMLLFLLLVVGIANFWLARHLEMQQIVVNVVIALTLSLPAYIRGILGGGDVKLLLSAAPLWPPVQFLLIFAIGVIALATVMTVASALAKNGLSGDGVNDSDTSNTETGDNAAEDYPTGLQSGLPLGTAVAIGALATSVALVIAPRLDRIASLI